MRIISFPDWAQLLAWIGIAALCEVAGLFIDIRRWAWERWFVFHLRHQARRRAIR